MRLTREAVLRGAFAILDDYGLGDLTMRRLASSLGVQPGGLYWHFANKQTLLAAMADEIVAQVPTGAGDDSLGTEWRTSLAGVAEGFRDALLRHRDGAELVTAGAALRPGAGEPMQTMIKIIQQSGMAETEAHAAASALIHFVLGHTAEVQAHDQLLRIGGLPDPHDEAPDPEVAFRLGLQIFLDGLQQRRQPAASAPDTPRS
jgi:TetR/AcrR family tetracycline transcriptional repressor